MLQLTRCPVKAALRAAVQMETMGFEPIHRVCRTRMLPSTSSPLTTSISRGPESRTRILLRPKQAASHQALTPKKNGWGGEIRTPILTGNNRACCQLHHTPTFIWLEAESNRR